MAVSGIVVGAEGMQDREGMSEGERIAKVEGEGSYNHLATRADVEKVRTELESVRSELKSDIANVTLEVRVMHTRIVPVGWVLGVLISLWSVFGPQVRSLLGLVP